MSSDDIHARLTLIADAVTDALTAISEGELVDLTALEDEVEAVCAEISGSNDHDNPAQLEAAIHALLTDLNTLTQALDNQHAQQLTSDGLSGAAHAAYGSSRQGSSDGEDDC